MEPIGDAFRNEALGFQAQGFILRQNSFHDVQQSREVVKKIAQGARQQLCCQPAAEAPQEATPWSALGAEVRFLMTSVRPPALRQATASLTDCVPVRELHGPVPDS